MSSTFEFPSIKIVPINTIANKKTGQEFNLTIINSQIPTNDNSDSPTKEHFLEVLRKRQKYIKIIQNVTKKDDETKGELNKSTMQLIPQIAKKKLLTFKAKIIKFEDGRKQSRTNSNFAKDNTQSEAGDKNSSTIYQDNIEEERDTCPEKINNIFINKSQVNSLFEERISQHFSNSRQIIQINPQEKYHQNLLRYLAKKRRKQIQKVEEVSTAYIESVYRDQQSKLYMLLKPYNFEIILKLSPFPNRNKTVFFQYPEYCEDFRQEINIERRTQNDFAPNYLSFSVSDSSIFYPCVIKSLKYNGFRIESGSNWNLLWTGLQKSFYNNKFNMFQRTNHFPGTYQVARKDNLWRNINRLKSLNPNDYSIAPITYILPEDLNSLMSELEKDKRHNKFWILKPHAQSCGRGIKVLNEKGVISLTKHKNDLNDYLISKYISNPHLINGYKYDLRVYVLVTSFNPLLIYVFKNGLVRFATEKFSLELEEINKRFIHLTNYSVNKNCANYKENNLDSSELFSNLDPELVSKWDFEMLKRKYQKLGINYDEIMDSIKEIIIKSLITIEPHIVNQMKKNNLGRRQCFDLFGMDILIDNNLRPWLIEVNASPSLACGAVLDKRIKTMLLCDAFHLIGLVPFGKPIYTDKSLVFYNNLKNERNEISEEEKNIIYEFEEEQDRIGHFELAFPIKENIQKFSKYFECRRKYNNILWNYILSLQNVEEFFSTYKHNYSEG